MNQVESQVVKRTIVIGQDVSFHEFDNVVTRTEKMAYYMQNLPGYIYLVDNNNPEYNQQYLTCPDYEDGTTIVAYDLTNVVFRKTYSFSYQKALYNWLKKFKMESKLPPETLHLFFRNLITTYFVTLVYDKVGYSDDLFEMDIGSYIVEWRNEFLGENRLYKDERLDEGFPYRLLQSSYNCEDGKTDMSKRLIQKKEYFLFSIQEREDLYMEYFGLPNDTIQTSPLEVVRKMYSYRLSMPVPNSNKLRTIDPKEVSLEELFNSMVTSNHVPFVSFGKFFKIQKSSPDYKWTSRNLKFLQAGVRRRAQTVKKVGNKFIQICVLKRSSEPSAEQAANVDVSKYFSLVYLEQHEDGFYMDFDHELTFSGNVSFDTFSDRALSVFQNKTIYFEKQNAAAADSQVYTSVDLYDTQFDENIFSDMVMNHPILCRFLYLQENITTNPGTYFVIYKHPTLGTCKVTLAASEAVLAEPLTKPKMVKAVHLRIKGSSIDICQSCLDSMKRFFYVYMQEKAEVIEFYQRFDADFTEKVYTITKKDNEITLKEAYPELFENTSRACSILPQIISREEYDALPRSDRMVFPRTPEEGKQFYYKCENARRANEHLVPSLRAHIVGSKMPYLPCCSAFGKSKLFYEYYPEELEYEAAKSSRGSGKSMGRGGGSAGGISRGGGRDGGLVSDADLPHYQNLIKTDKFLEPGQHGVLPDNLKSLLFFFKNFNSSRSDVVYNVGRVGLGIRQSKSSFLECVMKALKQDIFSENRDNNLPVTTDVIDAKIKETRAMLGRIAKETGICAQEFFDYSPEEMEKEIADVDVYLDPRKTFRLLEEFYKVKIYIFSKNKAGGFLEIPRHTHGHLHYVNRFKYTILLFDHSGSERDHSTYNLCELITVWINGNFRRGDYIFYTEDPMIESITKMYMEMSKSYQVGKLIAPFEPLPYDLLRKIVAQYIDDYGKCRALYVKEEKLLFYCTPLPPLVGTKENRFQIKRMVQLPVLRSLPTLATVITFCTENNLEIESFGQTDDDSKVTKEVNIRVNNQVLLTIKVQDDSVFPVEKEKAEVKYNLDTFSWLENFTEYRKLARYLLEYTYWTFSNYLLERERDDRSIIEKFMKEYVVVDPTHAYTHVSRIFRKTETNNNVYKKLDNNKLVLVFPNKDFKKSVEYTLKMKWQNNKQFLENFHKEKRGLQHYYENISEFKKSSRHLLMSNGDESLDHWSNYGNVKYTLRSNQDTISSSDVTFFFQNDGMADFSGKTFFAVRVNSFTNAYKVYQAWKADKKIDLSYANLKLANDDGKINAKLHVFVLQPNKQMISFEISTSTPDKEESSLQEINLDEEESTTDEINLNEEESTPDEINLNEEESTPDEINLDDEESTPNEINLNEDESTSKEIISVQPESNKTPDEIYILRVEFEIGNEVLLFCLLDVFK